MSSVKEKNDPSLTLLWSRMDSVCTGTFVSQIVHGLTSYALGLTWQVVLVSSPFLLVSNSSNYGELAYHFMPQKRLLRDLGLGQTRSLYL